MKSFNILLVFLLVAIGCKDAELKKNAQLSQKEAKKHITFGDLVSSSDTYSTNEALQMFRQLKATDTLRLKIKGRVHSVCKAKGCWLEMELQEGTKLMVKFKDYSFFVPTNIQGNTVVVEGIGYLSEMSVKEQKHYALDAMASERDIVQIQNPKATYQLVADGILLFQ